jgi:hypothetical protein
MSIEWLIYFADVSLKMTGFFAILAAISVVISVPVFFAFIFHSENKNADHPSIPKTYPLRKYVKFPVLGFILAIIFLCTACLIPSKQTIYLIAGAHMAKQSNIPAKVMMIVNEKLDELLVKEDKK